jgi:hypothetical protein
MRARTAWAVPAAVAAAVLAAVGGVLAWKAESAPAAAPAAVTVATATVTRTRLSTTQTLSGTLGYGAAQTLNGGKAGIVTWLPAGGAMVSRSQPLYRVDNEPVPLLYGSTPLYRRLNAAGMVGPDVRVVADNLAALGYDVGYQPPVGSVITQASIGASPSGAPLAVSAKVFTAQATPTPSPATPSGSGSPSASDTPSGSGSPSGTPSHPASSSTATRPSPSPTTSRPASSGSSSQKTITPTPTPSHIAPVTATVRPGDAVLTTALIGAIARWQAAVGLQATGVLGVGDVLVEPGAVRVTGLQAQIGDQATGTLMMVATTVKTVTVPVDSADVVSVRRSGRVTITLPGGSTTSGTVISIGTSVQSGQVTSDGQPQQTVTVAPNDPVSVAGLASAPVQVTFTGQTANGVLAVPVVALLALSGGGYALQLPGGRLIPVQAGLFAQGLVQVSGPGITPGLRVVTSG